MRTQKKKKKKECMRTGRQRASGDSIRQHLCRMCPAGICNLLRHGLSHVLLLVCNEICHWMFRLVEKVNQRFGRNVFISAAACRRRVVFMSSRQGQQRLERQYDATKISLAIQEGIKWNFSSLLQVFFHPLHSKDSFTFFFLNRENLF